MDCFVDTGETPVVGVHNLAYDIHFLMPYINRMHDKGYLVDCCFKSSIKPLTISFKRDGATDLIIWDTLTFSGKSLAKMGRECGYLKKSGDWDYSLDRTPATPLTDEEVGYALADVVVPFMWLKWWHGLNPEVPLEALAMPVMTKTSIVRYKCRELGMGVEEYGKPVYERFLGCCKSELPKTEMDYNLMIRSTSAGWTFTAGASAGRAFDTAMKYDATSMHPSHMVSHLYPYDFRAIPGAYASRFFQSVVDTPLERVLDNWIRPFPVAFNARVMFTNLRPNSGSVFERDDLMLHGSALFSDYTTDADKETEGSDMEFNAVNEAGYSNVAVNGKYSFGKLVSADLCIISLNELNAWVHAQVYDWDSFYVMAMSGTENFRRVPEYVILSVGAMLERKKVVKDAMHGKPPSTKPDWVPEEVYQGMLGYSEHGSESVDAFYKQVKADLNSLYGMFATNEAKQSMVYDDGDFRYDGLRGFDNLPSRPKAWYNFGLRVAAWSRVQQCCAMLLLDRDGDVVDSFINGDTDSFCFDSVGLCDGDVMQALRPLHDSIECSMKAVMRVDELPPHFDGLGLYMVDCEPSLYCAVANKRYAYTTGDGSLHVASAGVPNKSVEYALREELDSGESFEAATIYALGYLATYCSDLSGTKYKAQPEYSEYLECDYTMIDYRGVPYTYPKGTPVGIYLDEAEKTLGEGYADDYRRCLENSGVEYRGHHEYTKE